MSNEDKSRRSHPTLEWGAALMLLLFWGVVGIIAMIRAPVAWVIRRMR